MPNLRDNTHPVNVQPIEVLALETIPASGSEDVTDAIACAGWDWASFFIEYQRGGANGAAWFQMEFSPYATDQTGIENWFKMSLTESGDVVAGQLAESIIQIERKKYTAQFAGTECWQYGPVHFARCYERFRVRYGDTNTVPGTLKITALFHTG